MIVLADVLTIVLPIVVGIACLLIGMAIILFVPFFKKTRASSSAKKIIRDAEIKAEHITKNAQLDGKQAVYEMPGCFGRALRICCPGGSSQGLSCAALRPLRSGSH